MARNTKKNMDRKGRKGEDTVRKAKSHGKSGVKGASGKYSEKTPDAPEAVSLDEFAAQYAQD